jgi:hypothetical protein
MDQRSGASARTSQGSSPHAPGSDPVPGKAQDRWCDRSSKIWIPSYKMTTSPCATSAASSGWAHAWRAPGGTPRLGFDRGRDRDRRRAAATAFPMATQGRDRARGTPDGDDRAARSSADRRRSPSTRLADPFRRLAGRHGALTEGPSPEDACGLYDGPPLGTPGTLGGVSLDRQGSGRLSRTDARKVRATAAAVEFRRRCLIRAFKARPQPPGGGRVRVCAACGDFTGARRLALLRPLCAASSA